MKKSYKKKKAYQTAIKAMNRKGMLNNEEGVFKPMSAFKDNSMVRDSMAGAVKR